MSNWVHVIEIWHGLPIAAKSVLNGEVHQEVLPMSGEVHEEVLPMSGEVHEEVGQCDSGDRPKLEIPCDDANDDVEIVDLEDIEVNDVITVDLSEQASERMSYENISLDIGLCGSNQIGISSESKVISLQSFVEDMDMNQTNTEDAQKKGDNMSMIVLDDSQKHVDNSQKNSDVVHTVLDDSQANLDDSQANFDDSQENMGDSQKNLEELQKSITYFQNNLDDPQKSEDGLSDPVSQNTEDSQICVGFEDLIINYDNTLEITLMKAESVETNDLRVNIAPLMDSSDGLNSQKSSDDKEMSVSKESSAVRKWERENIFENLTSKVSLSVCEDINVPSNVTSNSFAQKLDVELQADNDDLKFKAKTSFSIENIKKVIHKRCAKVGVREDMQTQAKAFPNIVGIDEPVHSKVLNDSSIVFEVQQEETVFCNTDVSAESLCHTNEAFTFDEEPKKVSVNLTQTTAITQAMPDNFIDSAVDSLHKIVCKTSDPSARESSRRFSNRFKKHSRAHMAKKSISRYKKLTSTCIEKTGDSTIMGELMDYPIDSISSEVVSLSTVEILPGSPTHHHHHAPNPFHTSEVVSTTSSDFSHVMISCSPASIQDSGVGYLNDIKKEGINTKVNIRSGLHLTSSFQPHVSIIPLPMESLTRLAMKTKLEHDSFRDDSLFGGEVETINNLSPVTTPPEVEHISSSVEQISTLETISKATEASNSRDKKNETINPQKRKSSFLEALNELHALPVKTVQRRSERIARVDRRPCSNDDENCPDKTTTTTNKALIKDLPDKSSSRKKPNIIPIKGRTSFKRSSGDRNNILPSKSFSHKGILNFKDHFTSMESILPAMDRPSVMSLPKIRKLTDSNPNRLSSQRNYESHGVLEKIEKVMAEDDCLKKYTTQSNTKVFSPPIYFSSNIKSHVLPMMSCASISSRPADSFSNCARSSNPDFLAGKGDLFYDTKFVQKTPRANYHECRPSNISDKSSDMKVGVDLLWMKKNRSHDPLGLEEDDDEENCDSNKLQGHSEEAKNDQFTSDHRINFVASKTTETDVSNFSESASNEDDSNLLNKLRDELNDLDVIVTIQKRMVDPESTDTSFTKNQQGVGDNSYKYDDRPFLKSGSSTQRPCFFEPYNSRRYYSNKFENRGSRWYISKKLKGYPTPEAANTSSLFQTPSSSGSEGGFIQSMDCMDADECLSKTSKAEGNADKSSEENRFREHRNFAQQSTWGSSCKYYPWQTPRKFYKQSRYDNDHISQYESDVYGMNNCNKKDYPYSRSFHNLPHHDFDYYTRSYSQENISNSKFTNQEDGNGNKKSSWLLSLVKSKVTKHLETSPVPSESYLSVVEDIMRKLRGMAQYNNPPSKTKHGNEEGECDDSENENDSDLDNIIKQYLQEIGPYYIASQQLKPSHD